MKQIKHIIQHLQKHNHIIRFKFSNIISFIVFYNHNNIGIEISLLWIPDFLTMWENVMSNEINYIITFIVIVAHMHISWVGYFDFQFRKHFFFFWFILEFLLDCRFSKTSAKTGHRLNYNTYVCIEIFELLRRDRPANRLNIVFICNIIYFMFRYCGCNLFEYE